jgi:hypothetical protein
LLGKKPAKAIDVSRAIYDLVHHGIKSVIKRDVLLSTLTDLTVRILIYPKNHDGNLTESLSAHPQGHGIDHP